MGFGSYDESEQQNQGTNDDEEDGESVAVHEHDHDGEVNFETDASTDDLIGRLSEMKNDPEDE